MEKILVQISFAGNADLENVRNQLIKLREEDKYQFVSCFLTRKMVEEKEFSTEIVDMLDEVLGTCHDYAALEYDNFDTFMSNIQDVRQEVANAVNRMFVLDSGTAAGVADEIKLFTDAKVILLP